ncbi:dihydrolipoamide acetyltransferase family protein [soil metagenome]
MSSSATNTSLAIVMPKMGISVSEGTVVEWLKQPGDWVEADETICEATTDKIDVEIPAPSAGRMLEIVAEAGTTVDVGETIARIDAAATAGEAHPDENRAKPERDPDEIDRSEYFSPVVKRMAAKHDIDLGRIEGHGVGGRIRKRDLTEHLEARHTERPLHSDSPYVAARAAEGVAARNRPEPEAAEATNGSAEPSDRSVSMTERREPLTPMRRSIGEHMVRSIATSAHCTTVVEVDFAAVSARLGETRGQMARRGVKMTYLAFVAEATIRALEEFPIVNASISGEEVVYHDDVNLWIAVSLGEDGLVVPVIPKAQRLGVEGLAVAISDLAERARSRRLEPDDVAGGTFTITNPGQFGAVLATPIINQPQVGILDLEAIVKRAVVIDDAIAIRPMAYLPMSWDHRALDGVLAARFLGAVKQRLENGEQR